MLEFAIRAIEDAAEKSALCDTILHALPGWFGIESSIQEYIKEVAALPVFAALVDGRAAGFVALKTHNAYTAEICVMGILPEYHRLGIGRALIERCEARCREKGVEFLTVKTLDEARPDEGYAKTRRFYFALGFRPLEVFPLLWDEANPCLFLGKCLRCP